MITVVFVKPVFLPRFSMKVGDVWEKREENMTEKGFNLGGGFVPCDSYVIIEDESP